MPMAMKRNRQQTCRITKQHVKSRTDSCLQISDSVPFSWSCFMQLSYYTWLMYLNCQCVCSIWYLIIIQLPKTIWLKIVQYPYLSKGFPRSHTDLLYRGNLSLVKMIQKTFIHLTTGGINEGGQQWKLTLNKRQE